MINDRIRKSSTARGPTSPAPSAASHRSRRTHRSTESPPRRHAATPATIAATIASASAYTADSSPRARSAATTFSGCSRSRRRNRLRLEHRRQHAAVRQRQALHQRLLEHIPPQRIRPRLQHRPQPPPRISRPQRPQRLPNRRRMVRKVVDDGHAVHLRAHLQPPLHRPERRQRLHNRRRRNALPSRQRRRRRRVQRVVFAGHRQPQLRKRLARAQQRPVRSRRPHAACSAIRQCESAQKPYRSTAQNAFATHSLTFSLPSNATTRPRRGTRFTSRLNAVFTAARSG